MVNWLGRPILAMVEGADACWGVGLGLNMNITVGRAYSQG